MIKRTAAQVTYGFTRNFAAAMGALALAVSPVSAQEMETFDPDEAYASASSESDALATDTGAIDADLEQPRLRSGQPTVAPPLDRPQPATADNSDIAEAQPATSTAFEGEFADYGEAAAETTDTVDVEVATETVAAADSSNTYAEDDLIGAAEGVFGKGAKGLAGLIEDLLRKQGEPNGYIVGREAGGAFVVGARYGSGTLFHKVEGEQKVYWTGPSVGFDAGANAANTFVLVYNLFDTEELFERYPAGEGQAYLVGGMHASYMRKGDVVLIPIRVGAGVRLGINAGYMKFSKKQRWLPF
ncbi:DUF1134 domain-containing protein [Erythrobacter ani]|uniref:DUF1134 domain-containing protein n=1 Tax=Erythrobacter ani TaxID=2827235 RepID=A0ABS6SJ86_9SPHN|nr:DUF1134 domain-containing protein [Erythrobacter ani]MBV7265064.1 DUF1134 domain-containing protein [Erythrobacter ani]